MTTFLIQSTFQFGEVSPLLFAREDSAIYYRSARKLHNVVTIPQGGLEVRFGTVFLDEIEGGVTDYTDVKPTIMDYEDGERYLFIFRNLALDVYHDDALVQTIVTTYATAEIEALNFAQSPTLLFIAHGVHAPAILSRTTTAHNSWSLSAAPTWINFPTYDFLQNYNAINFSIQIGGVNITTAQNNLGQVVTLNSSANIFTTLHVGGLYFGASGTLRIQTFVSATSVTARIINIFDPASTLFVGSMVISGNDSVLAEIAFSDTRGWPKKVAFFQNRIFFARTKSLPGGLFGSNYNGTTATTYNFDDSEALDTSAVSTSIYSRRSALIEHLVGYKSLLVFTTSGLFSSPLLEDFPITPLNIAYINLQTADSSNATDPQILDNDVIFFDKGGKKVKDVNLIARTGTFETNNISVLAPHLIDQPYSAGVYENSTVKDGTWLLTTMAGTNGTLEGTLAIYQSVPEQQITAWSNASTDGYFRHVAADEETVYFIVEREIDNVTKLYIEKLSWDVRTDCASVQDLGAPSTTVTNLDHLEGKEVRVIGDGGVMETKTVTSGEIELEYAVTDVQVGLNYNPEVVPMPLNVPTQMGNNIYLPKSVKRMYVDFYESLGIKVNGESIPPFRIGTDTYDDPAIPKTDFVAISAFNGWNPRQQFSITQSDPLPFTLIGIGFEVEQ